MHGHKLSSSFAFRTPVSMKPLESRLISQLRKPRIKGRLQHRMVVLLVLLLSFTLITTPFATCRANAVRANAVADSQARHSFLNDRAAGIIGSLALGGRGFASAGGLTGRGQIVGIADSGLDTGSTEEIHPDLQSTPGQMPKVAFLRSWAGRNVPDDPIGHGTHMAATIAGTGKASEGQYKGVAPGASLYFQALLDDKGKLSPPTDLRNLFEPAYSAGVRIHVNGWGGGKNNYGGEAAQIDTFIRRAPEFLAVFGAGNSGPGSGSITEQANSKNALVVGSSQLPRPALSSDSRTADRAAGFSSRGPTPDGRIKPELLVPGSAVVSARSSLVESNYPANSQYTRLGGTSMSAAVAGGASALLREYLKDEMKITAPSAALMKAALINGARVTDDRGSFGALDLESTVLALKEKTFALADNREGVTKGEEIKYTVNVTSSQAPFKATLAWTDPAAAAGSEKTLVNDLDLIVETPDGERIYGNHYLRGSEGSPDQVNNVEQVYLPRPATGEYTVIVKGTSVNKNTVIGSTTFRQDFALVYGQPLVSGTLRQVLTPQKIELSDGTTENLPSGRVLLATDGTTSTVEAAKMPAGSEVYLGKQNTYASVQTWRTGGVQALNTGDGYMLIEMNSQAREGGYYLASSAISPLLVNEEPVAVSEFVPGLEVTACVNPKTQTLWQVKGTYTNRSGIIKQVDFENRQLTLIEGNKTYKVNQRAVVTFVDTLVDADPANAPFGDGETASPENLMPGIPVKLIVTPGSEEVQYIAVKRNLVVGWLKEVDPAKESVVLESESGKTYTVFPGAPVTRDSEESSLKQLKAGDYIEALLLPGTDTMVRVTAYSRVTFGRILYVSERDKSIQVMDYQNQFDVYRYNGDSRFYRWGLPIGIGSLNPGSLVRLTASPKEEEVWRLVVGEIGEETVKTLAFKAGKDTLYMTDGTHYRISQYTLITRGGYKVDLEDLLPGDRLTLTTLKAPLPRSEITAMVVAEPVPGAPKPSLQVSAWKQPNGYIIGGTTSADELSLYYGDGSRQVVPVGFGGQFSARIDNPSLESVQVVAMNSVNGGMDSQRINLYEVDRFGFADTVKHWAERQISAMAGRGLVSGFPDGRFYPQHPVTRAEFTALMVRLAGWVVKDDIKPVFGDADKIPAWAAGSIAAAQRQGLIKGYADGTFHPNEPINRAETAVLIDSFLRLTEETASTEVFTAPYRDRDQIPSWAQEAVDRLFSRQVMNGDDNRKFNPLNLTTRAEAAVLLEQFES